MTIAIEQIQATITALQTEIPLPVTLMAVSKGHPVEAIRAAYAAGLRHFGENRIQEAEAKISQLQDLPDLQWHLIGHLQSNKARKAVQIFNAIDSVDSLSLAARLSQLALESQTSLAIGLQVKLAPDPNKYGWDREQLWQELPHLAALPALHLSTLMTILPLGLDAAATAALFRECATLRDQIQAAGYPRLQLSMGMSGDYQLAIANGADMVRIGSALFGQR